MGSIVWERSLWNARVEDLAVELAFKKVRLETLAWEHSLLRAFAWELSLNGFVWDLPFGIVGLGSSAWDLWLGNLVLGSWAWGVGILRLGEPLGGSQGNPAGRAATPVL